MTQASGDSRQRAMRQAANRLARRGFVPEAPEGHAPLWDAAYFGLDRVAMFRNSTADAQCTVLNACASGLLAESWHIEQCGIDYCARMVLAAEDDDERRMFALIGADEALHSAWLAPWAEATASPIPDPFNHFISGLAEAGNPQPLAFVLQVVLEGFGITHYAALAEQCRDSALAATLRKMTQDEALHHAGGLASFSVDRLTAPDRSFLEDAGQVFLQMIRSGPQGVVAAVDRTVGLGSHADVVGLFADLDVGKAGANKLMQLRRLMAQPGMHWLVESLDQKGLFMPCSPVDCARIYAQIS